MNSLAAEPERALARPRLRHWLLLCGAAAVVTTIVFAFGRRTEPDCPLALAPECTNFGEVWAQKSFPWTLNVMNVGTEDVVVESIKASCRCTLFEPRSFIVPAGGTIAVRFKLNLWPKTAEDASRPLHSYATELVPVLRGATFKGEPWVLQGTIRTCPLTVTPSSVDFGERLIRGWPFASKVVRVEWREPAVGVTAACDTAMAAVRVVDSEPRRAQCEVEVLPSRNLLAGEHRFIVSLTPILPEGSVPPPLAEPAPFELPIRARVDNDVYLSPSSVSFGAMEIGRSGEAIVSARSTQDKPFAIVRVRAVGSDCPAIEALPEPQGSVHLFRLVQRATNAGSNSCEVRFTVSEESEEGEYEIVLPVAYHGVQRDKSGG